MSLKKVSIVGKPNVGKSQLFNRFIGERHSIVLSQPGITRDRITQLVEWLKYKFLLTDTGGYTKENYSFQEEINYQTEIAIKDSDLILFLVSAREELNIEDFYLAKVLKKKKVKNVLVVVNKCENLNIDHIAHKYRQLGFGNSIFISAEHGINTGQLLNTIVEKLNITDFEIKKPDSRIKIAVIGKPNVGKSSLCNALLREDRVIVSPISGTTRDVVDIDFSFNRKNYTILDTAGIKRYSQIYNQQVDKYSILRAQKAIERAHQILLILDISEPLTELDERIGGLIYKANIPTIVVGNKWDLIDYKSDSEQRNIENNIRRKFPFLKWAPIVFISAKHRDKISSIFKKMALINTEIKKPITDYQLESFIYRIRSSYSIPTVKGEKIKLFSMKKVEGQIPTFLIICNNSDLLHFSYARLIENQIRKEFNYKYTPITVIYKSKI